MMGSSRGWPFDDAEEDDAEGFLHLRVLEEVVENELRFLAALDFHHDAHAVAVGFVADIGDAFDFFGLNELGDTLNQPGLVHLERDFRDDDAFAILARLLDGGLGAHDERTAAGLVRLQDAVAAGDVAAGGKIGAGQNFHYVFERGVRLFDEQDGGFNHFAQIVRWNVRRHADGDAGSSVDEKIRGFGGQHRRLFARLVKILDEINGLFFEIGEELFGDAREPRFRITHGRGRVAVHGAEISLAVHEHVTHVEVLREADERGVDDGFAVGMVVAGGIAADLGALAEAAV